MQAKVATMLQTNMQLTVHARKYATHTQPHTPCSKVKIEMSSRI